MLDTSLTQEQKRTIIAAFVIGFVAATIGMLIGCGAEQPVISEEELFIEQAEIGDEYYLIIPDQGIRYKTSSMKEPISIKFGDTLLQIEDQHANTNAEITVNTDLLHVVITSKDIGQISMFTNNYVVDEIDVSIGKWILPNGLGVGSTRKDMIDRYRYPPKTLLTGSYYLYEKQGLSFIIEWRKFIDSSFRAPIEDTDIVESIGVRPIPRRYTNED